MKQSPRFSPKLSALAALSLLCSGCISADAGGSGTAAPTFSEADEALYQARFERLSEGGSGGAGLAAYDTLEPVAGSLKPSATPTAQTKSLSQDALTEARAYAQARNSSAFLVWRDGALEAEDYFGDFDASSEIVSKSLAKPITAILIGRAIAQGHIKSLDQPVADFITEWKGDSEREKIRIRHLLDMRAGFLRQSFAPDRDDVLNRAYLHPRHDEVIIHEYPLTHEPGTRYEYSNATSEMVAPVLERATGMRYGDYLSQALLEPLGAAGGQIWVNRPGGTAHSGCCVLLPARTYLKFGVLLMQDGMWNGERLLPEGYVAQMTSATTENPHYGLGVWVAGPYKERRGFAHPSIPFGQVLHSQAYADKDLYLFDGNGNQVVYMIPSKNMVVLRTGGRPPKEAEWDNTIVPNLLIRGASRNSSLPEAQPQ